MILMAYATLEEAWETMPNIENFMTTPETKEETHTPVSIQEEESEPDTMMAERLETKLDYNLDRIHNEMRTEIERLNKKIEKLLTVNSLSSRTNNQVDFFNNNIHDIILFMIFGLFVMLIMDIVLKFKKN